MCFKRSTRKIVTSGRHRESNTAPDNTGWQVPEGCIDPEAIFVLPVLLLVLVALIVGIAISGKSGHVASVPIISQGQVVVAVSADAALCGQAVPGDVVRLYTTDGQPIPELQYVQVYNADTTEGLLLLVDDLQAAALVSQEHAPTVTLVVHGDDARAAELIDLQARINDPDIKLTLQPFAEAAPGANLELTFQASVDPDEAALPQVEWASSDPDVATVENGVISAHRTGTAKITAACGDVQASCELTVRVELTEIQLDITQAAIAVGESLQLTAAPVPADAADFDIVWSAEDSSVAEVLPGGEIIGLKPGKTNIIATCGDIQTKCAVTVGYHAEIVQLDRQALQLIPGQEDTITASVYPSADMIDIASFESSDPNVATVDEHGRVVAGTPGTATITFRCGETTATCTVVVIDVPA